MSLGRRLQFEEPQLTEFDKDNEAWSEKALAMLMTWKERDGSDATYQVLHDALCHEYVEPGELFSNDILRARLSLRTPSVGENKRQFEAFWFSRPKRVTCTLLLLLDKVHSHVRKMLPSNPQY